jgi:hypothetical protein
VRHHARSLWEIFVPLMKAVTAPSLTTISMLFHWSCGLIAFLRAAPSAFGRGPLAPPMGKMEQSEP